MFWCVFSFGGVLVFGYVCGMLGLYLVRYLVFCKLYLVKRRCIFI